MIEQEGDSTVRGIRERMTDATLVLLGVMGSLAILTVLLRSRAVGWATVNWLYLAVLLAWLGGALFRRRLSFAARVALILVPLFVIGTAALIHLGIMGQGQVILLIAVVYAAIVLGVRWGVVLLVAASIVMGLVGAGFVMGLLVSQVPEQAHVGHPLSWATRIVTTLTIGLSVLVVQGMFQRSLFGSLAMLSKRERELSGTNARLETEIEGRTEATRALSAQGETLRLVNDLADKLHRELNVEAIARETVDALVQLTDPPVACVYLLQDEGTELRAIAHRGLDPESLELVERLPVVGSVDGVALARREAQISHDPQADVVPVFRQRAGELGGSTMVVVPLVFEDRSLGTIDLLFVDGRRLTAEELQTFQTIGNTVALAIANARHLATLGRQAFHDSLTGLPNRAALHRAFEDAFGGDGSFDRRFGLVLLDLDRFKEINDSLGHHVGDKLLKEIGPRIQSAAADRVLHVYRLGGDEFAIVLPALEGEADVVEATRELLSSLRRPYRIGSTTLRIDASAGVALYPLHGADSHQLLRCSDIAMYEAKRSAKGVVVYDPAFDENTPERLELMAELTHAILNDELVLHYQPQVDLYDGSIVGLETLVRWQHPRLGLLPPGAFIPLAEVGDLIHPLTYAVVESALRQLRRWRDRHPALNIAINLSARNLLDVDCVERLRGIMDDFSADPARVELEVTETALITDSELTATALEDLSALGVRLSIDDFGTGYSSLAFLKRYAIHALKIDRSFVSDLLHDKQSHEIVSATLRMAINLDLRVVAEGIEDEATMTQLRNLGCRFGQGYFFARPGPAAEIEEFLEQGVLV